MLPWPPTHNGKARTKSTQPRDASHWASSAGHAVNAYGHDAGAETSTQCLRLGATHTTVEVVPGSDGSPRAARGLTNAVPPIPGAGPNIAGGTNPNPSDERIRAPGVPLGLGPTARRDETTLSWAGEPHNAGASL